MNRLQKKCFIAATALHALLLGILLFGSAFFVPSQKTDTQQVLKAYDPTMINDLLTTGGNPNVSAVPPSAPAPAPPAPPAPQVQPPTPPTPAPPKPPKPEVSKVVEPPTVKPLLTPKELDPIKPKETTQTSKPTPPKL